MNTKHWAFNCCGEGYAQFEITNLEWNKESTEWKISLKLEPDTKYQIGVSNYSFLGLNNFHPKKNYTVTFKTKEK